MYAPQNLKSSVSTKSQPPAESSWRSDVRTDNPVDRRRFCCKEEPPITAPEPFERVQRSARIVDGSINKTVTRRSDGVDVVNIERNNARCIWPGLKMNFVICKRTPRRVQCFDITRTRIRNPQLAKSELSKSQTELGMNRPDRAGHRHRAPRKNQDCMGDCRLRAGSAIPPRQ